MMLADVSTFFFGKPHGEVCRGCTGAAGELVTVAVLLLRDHVIMRNGSGFTCRTVYR